MKPKCAVFVEKSYIIFILCLDDGEEARSAQVPPYGKQSLNKTVGQVPNGRGERKSMSTGSQMHPKAGSHKLTSASRPILTSVQHRKKLGNSNGSGPGRPLGPEDLAAKKRAAAPERRVPTAVAKSSTLSVQKPPSSKLHPSASKQPSILKKHVDQKNEFQKYTKEKVLQKPQVCHIFLHAQMLRSPFLFI